MKRLWVDFNEVYDGDYVWTSTRHVPSLEQPEPGEWIELYDSDGERCWAVVRSFDDPIVHCKIDWSTWAARVRFDPIESPERELVTNADWAVQGENFKPTDAAAA